MNKTLLIILVICAVALIAYNVTLIDFENPFEGNSIVAIIGVMASLCALVLILIYYTSKKIQKNLEED